jgi:PRTRC genetic system protein F
MLLQRSTRKNTTRRTGRRYGSIRSAQKQRREPTTREINRRNVRQSESAAPGTTQGERSIHSAATATIATERELQNHLALPKFTAKVPSFIEYSNASGNLAAFADALLDAGILDETDWHGALIQSIQHGVNRWISCHASDWQKLRLGFRYSDDVRTFDVYTYPTMESEQPVAVFGLWCSGHVVPCCAGARVMELENRLRGAGYAAFSLMECAAAQINGYTPHSGLESCEHIWEYWDWEYADVLMSEASPEIQKILEDRNHPKRDSYIEQQTGKLSPKSFCAALPKALFKGTKTPASRLLRRLQKSLLPHERDAELGQLVEACLRLVAAWKNWKAHEAAESYRLMCVDAEQNIPAVLFWQTENDPTMRVLDDILEERYEHGVESTEVIWFNAFHIGSEQEARRAVQELRLLLELLNALDETMALMHKEQPVVEFRKTVPKGKPLDEVFANVADLDEGEVVTEL